jgi:outer membrane protein assembly factor BamB
MNPFAGGKSAKMPELAPIQATVDVRTLWQASIGKSQDYALRPAIVGEVVFAAAEDGSVARFEGGKVVWRVNIGQTIAGGVGASDKLVVVGTAKGEVIVLAAADGKEVWKARVSAEILAAPAIGEGLVVVRSGDNRLFAFDLVDGKRKWVYQRANPALSVRSSAPPVIADRLVFAGFPGGKLVAVSAQNGAAVWEGTVALPKGATELDRVADIVGAPAFDQRGVCAVAFQGRLACFDLGNGNLVWARELSSSVGLTMDSRNVYVSDDKGVIQAFDRSSGSSLWKQDKLAGRDLTAPLIRRGLIVLGDGKGVVHFIGREDGQFVARSSTDGSGFLAPPQALGGSALLQTRSGALVALDTQ